MFFGRSKELEILESLYNSDKFEFLVMYGRRRSGKTSILQQFAKNHNVMFFSAQEQNNNLNMNEFVSMINNYFKINYFAKFDDWSEIINYLCDLIEKSDIEKPVLIIDEFPFIAKEYPAIKSIFQHTIDHKLKNKNFMLILCGSSVSYMVNDVMGYQSPLYGRKTSQLEIKPFDYTITKEFFPKMSNIDKVISYGILGGIPLYLSSFSDAKSVKDNIKDNILSPQKFLFDEPLNLLRAELREPAIYNSILTAIANGATKLSEISSKTNEETAKCSKYISVLKEIRLVNKNIPYGEKFDSKKGIYTLSDNFYKFWFKYIFNKQSQIELIGIDNFANQIEMDLSNFIGPVFENICTQYLVNQAKKNTLPFIPNSISKWWGNNPITKSQDDIDIMGTSENNGIFCECKFRNELFDLPELNDLITSSKVFTNIENKYYYIFVKSGYTKAVLDASKDLNIKLLTIDDLFKD